MAFLKNLKDIEISDRKLFNSYVADIEVSFYNFSNIFMWRKAMNYKYAIISDALCIFAQYRDHAPFAFFPLGACDIKETLLKISDLIDFPLNICPLNKKMAEKLSLCYPEAALEYRADLSDYIYNTSDLSALSGKKFHKKRNHLNKFTKTYNYKYHKIQPDNLKLLRQAVDLLYSEEDKNNLDLADEFTAINELVNHFEQLELKAGVITVDDRIIAYSIGENLNSDTALIHTEKADRNFDGAYTAVNYEFVRNEFADTEFINREEDMGIEGLRQAKSSYNPIALNNVYSITFKNKEDFNYVKSCNVKQMACSCGRLCK